MAIQRLTITRLDGSEITVTPNLADSINFEGTLRKNPQWGTLAQNQVKAGPFRAWSAGRREGTVTESWEDFLNNTANVEVAEDPAPADDDATEVDGLGLDTRTIQPTT
jgi:hypothetical protein